MRFMNKHFIFLTISIVIHISFFAFVSMVFTNKTIEKQESSTFSISLISPQIVQEQTKKQEKPLENPLEVPKKNKIVKKEKIIDKQENILKEKIINKKEEVVTQKQEKPSEKSYGMLVEENIEKEVNITKSEVTNESMLVKEDIKIVQTDEEKYLDLHLREIRKLIDENIYYPRSARLRGMEGEVLIGFYIKKDGLVKDIKVINKDNKTLSNAAIKTIERIRFPKPEVEIEIIVPIVYKLKN